MSYFEDGDIVYWCSRRGYKFSVHWGRVDEQVNRSVVYVDYLQGQDTRCIDDVHIDEFQSESRYKKLPKGWTYNTPLFEMSHMAMGNEDDAELAKEFNLKKPETIKKLYNEGLLVKTQDVFRGTVEAEITNEGYRVVKKYDGYNKKPTSISIRPDKLYYSYAAAQQEVDANVAELKRQSELSYHDWSIEQIDNMLNKWQAVYGHTEEAKQGYREWMVELDDIDNVEVRVFSGSIQWKYWKHKTWRNIEL